MARITYVTLVANTVETVTLDAASYVGLEVINVDGTAVVYLRADGEAPSVAGDDCNVVPAAVGAVLRLNVAVGTNEIQLISAGTPLCGVRGL